MSEVDVSEWRHPVDKARELLVGGTCPICGRGPWKSPLNHVSRKHGIDRWSMRNACDLTLKESVADPALSQRFSERSSEIDMSQVNGPGRPRARQRWTKRGRATNDAIIDAVNSDPRAEQWRADALVKAHGEAARTKHSVALKQFWEQLSPEEKARRTAHLKRTPADLPGGEP